MIKGKYLQCVKLCEGFFSQMIHLAVLVELAAEGHSQVSCCSRNSVSSKQGFPILKATVSSLTDVHVLEARLHAERLTCESKGAQAFLSTFEVETYCELCGKLSRWVMVTNGCARVFVGVILLSASNLSIRFNRSINSRRSAFSANKSVPSK